MTPWQAGGMGVNDLKHRAEWTRWRDKVKQPEQHGISDETNEQARRLIDSALGEQS